MRNLVQNLQKQFSQQNTAEILQFQKQVNKVKEIEPLLKYQHYKEATQEFYELLDYVKDLKGLKEYNKYVQVQASCFNYLRQYKEAEVCYLNMVEYSKVHQNEFSQEEYFDLQLQLLNHYLFTDITNAEIIFNQIEEKHYEDMSLVQQSQYDHMKSSAYFLNEQNKNTLQKGFPYAVEVLNNKMSSELICSQALNNLAQAQLIKIQQKERSPKQEIQYLSQELDLYISNSVKKNELLRKIENIQNKQILMDDAIHSGPIELLFLSLSLNSYGIRILSIEDLLENVELFENCDQYSFNALQTLIEIFYKSKRHEMKKEAIQLLQMQYTIAKNKKKNQPRSIILYSAYFFDNKLYDQAKVLLKNLAKYDKVIILTQEDYYSQFDQKLLFSEHPKDDYFQIQSLQMLGTLSKIQNKQIEFDKITNQRKLLWMHCEIQKQSKIQVYQDMITPYILPKNQLVIDNYDQEMKYTSVNMKDIDQKEFQEFCDLMGFK